MQQHIQRFRGRPNITLYKFGTNHGALEVSSIFYRAMHFSALRTAQCTLVHCEVMHCALRGLGIACRPSVCPSVTLVDCDHIGWKSWKLITRTTSLTPSLFAAKRRSTYSQGNMGKFWGD